jgi:hypothetical protein
MTPALKAKIEAAHAALEKAAYHGEQMTQYDTCRDCRLLKEVHESLDAALRAACEEQRELDAGRVDLADSFLAGLVAYTIKSGSLVLDDEAGR